MTPASPRPTTIYHAASNEDWAARTETHYEPAAFADEGFVHLSSAAQMIGTLHKHYPGRTDLTVLTVNTGAVEAELVWEDLYGTGMEFPHLYGPINLSAIIATTPSACDADGGWDHWKP